LCISSRKPRKLYVLLWGFIEQHTDISQAMHAGVIRDIEQQRIKKERQLDFEMQRALEQEYKKIQAVHDGAIVMGDSTKTSGGS
jgi:hypothetical protein